MAAFSVVEYKNTECRNYMLRLRTCILIHLSSQALSWMYKQTLEKRGSAYVCTFENRELCMESVPQ